LLASRVAILSSMKIELPILTDAERTPLLEALLAVSDAQQQRIQELEQTVGKLLDESALLKGEKPRPTRAASRLPTPPPKPPPAAGDQRPASAKRSKNSSFATAVAVKIPLANPPAASLSKGWQDYFVQELLLDAKLTR
jgi:hypothetical protein